MKYGVVPHQSVDKLRQCALHLYLLEAEHDQLKEAQRRERERDREREGERDRERKRKRELGSRLDWTWVG